MIAHLRSDRSSDSCRRTVTNTPLKPLLLSNATTRNEEWKIKKSKYVRDCSDLGFGKEKRDTKPGETIRGRGYGLFAQDGTGQAGAAIFRLRIVKDEFTFNPQKLF